MSRAAAAAFGAAVLLFCAGLGIDLLRQDGIIPFHADWGLGAVVSAAGALIFVGTLVITLVVSIAQAAREREELARKEAAYWHSTAEAQDAARLRFMARFDHQLSNPAQAIWNMAREIEFAAGESESVKIIIQQVGRIKSLAADLDRLGHLPRELQVEDVDLEALLKDLVAGVQLQKHGQGRTVSIERNEVDNVLAQPGLLQQAVSNVLDNALKYSPPDTEVRLRLFQDESHVFVDVVDDGDGIPPEDREYVFEELYRGKHKRKVDGSGLGLPLARAILRSFGGDLTLQRVKRGTEMRFTLRRSSH